ncbi:MAG: hypothetical protein M1816_003167 [Peltula sp. TS41687]|nr:MAG: hypothetical protein M1816_003167 [Peltula sp. TS41687]
MSSNDHKQQEDPLVIAQRAERDLNTHSAKVGHAGSDSTMESGIDASVTNKFPGSTASYGSQASGAASGDDREIPVEEGGEVSRETGRTTKARDFEGEVGEGPEVKAVKRVEDNPGDDDQIRENVRGSDAGEG